MDVTLEKWKKTIGILPKGFSISIESGELQLYYCKKLGRPILVCFHYVGNIAEDAIVERASVTRFLTSNVGNFQRDKLTPKKGSKAQPTKNCPQKGKVKASTKRRRKA